MVMIETVGQLRKALRDFPDNATLLILAQIGTNASKLRGFEHMTEMYREGSDDNPLPFLMRILD